MSHSARRTAQTHRNTNYLSFALAAALVAAAQAPPLDHSADTSSFAAHMAQHLLIGDLAPLALAVGVRRSFVSPALAWPMWLANLCVWHVPVVYEAALHHVALHAVQHIALFAAGFLLWSPVFATRGTPPWFGDGSRLLYLLVTMFAGVVIGALFLWWPHVIYSTYKHLGDQRAGGGLMLIEGTVVTFAVAGWLVWRMFTRAEAGASPSP